MKKIVNIGRICMVPLLLVQIAFMLLVLFEVIDTRTSSMVFMVIGLWAMLANVNLLNMCYRHIKKLEQAGKQDVVSSSQTVEASSYEVVNTNNNVEASSQNINISKQAINSISHDVDKGSNDIADSSDKVDSISHDIEGSSQDKV